MPIYDVSADGKRFLIPEAVSEDAATIRVVQNWYEEFRDREQDYGMHPDPLQCVAWWSSLF